MSNCSEEITDFYEEGKESEKTKVAERVFTGDEVDLTFTYPVDDTRIAYVEIFAYTDGNYSQKSITDDYKLTPSYALGLGFLYYDVENEGYVEITEDTEIVLPKGYNGGSFELYGDLLGGKGNAMVTLYERATLYGTAKAIAQSDFGLEYHISTNTIGSKTYDMRATDDTGNTVYSKKLTVTIVPKFSVIDTSEDNFSIALPQDVTFSIDYEGYVGENCEHLKEIIIEEYDSDADAYVEVQNAEIIVDETTATSGTIYFVVPVAAPASGNTEYHSYCVSITDMFNVYYDCEFFVDFDKSIAITTSAGGRGTVKFYNYYTSEYANVFTENTDVVADLDCEWIYDIYDSIYTYDRQQYPGSNIVPTLAEIEVIALLKKYDSYAAAQTDNSNYVNVFKENERKWCFSERRFGKKR